MFEQLINWLSQPWPWYIAGPLIGLTVPLLLIIGNKTFGISSSLRHVCAACLPAKIPFFQYEWRKEAWNLFFVGGILVGGILTMLLIPDPNAVEVHPALVAELDGYGISDYSMLVPADLFSLESIRSPRGFILIVIGGFLVGFGTRYGGGCTSGHAIMGLSNFQWPSLVATIFFMFGGILMSNILLPLILNL